MAQNFSSKTSTILYSITKGISKIYSKESIGSLMFFKSITHSSIIYSFIFIHSVMNENDKNVPFIF